MHIFRPSSVAYRSVDRYFDNCGAILRRQPKIMRWSLVAAAVFFSLFMFTIPAERADSRSLGTTTAFSQEVSNFWGIGQ
jgi:hypothetical protein